MAKAWVLADHRPGNVTQVVGVAEALGIPFEIKKISYNRLGSLPNFILNTSDMGIEKDAQEALLPPYPDIIIGAGRRTAPVALSVKKKAIHAGKKAPKLVQIMHPGGLAKKFDLVAVPQHDNATQQGNIIETLTAPHKVSKKLLKLARSEWKESLDFLPSPRLVILIGGKNKSNDFTQNQISDLLTLTEKLAKQHNASLLVTSSRRTNNQSTRLIKSFLEKTDIPHYAHLWNQDAHENPYMGLLAFADMFVITGDSVSMISEASMTGKPIFIYAPQGSCSKSHQRLHSSLYEKSVARPLKDDNFDLWSYKAPDASQEIAAEIKKRFLK